MDLKFFNGLIQGEGPSQQEGRGQGRGRIAAHWSTLPIRWKILSFLSRGYDGSVWVGPHNMATHRYKDMELVLKDKQRKSVWVWIDHKSQYCADRITGNTKYW